MIWLDLRRTLRGKSSWLVYVCQAGTSRRRHLDCLHCTCSSSARKGASCKCYAASCHGLQNSWNSTYGIGDTRNHLIFLHAMTIQEWMAPLYLQQNGVGNLQDWVVNTCSERHCCCIRNCLGWTWHGSMWYSGYKPDGCRIMTWTAAINLDFFFLVPIC